MKNEMMWAYLIHFGVRFWNDGDRGLKNENRYNNESCVNEEVWRKVTDFLPAQGINTIVIDIGEGIVYDSHPEIALETSWPKEKFKKELDRLRSIGLTPIPKLNFSKCHDIWLGKYHFMTSTPKYYEVCEDIIKEVYELFDKPKFFHLGLDEENVGNMVNKMIAIQRNPELWWHDAYFFFDVCDRLGIIPWVWADAFWHKGNEYLEKMPKSVIQSNWYYFNLNGSKTGSAWAGIMKQKDALWIDSYKKLDEAGYLQVPTCSGLWYAKSANSTMENLKRDLSSDRVIGYMTAPWYLTYDRNFYSLLDDAYRFGLAKKKHYSEYCKEDGLLK